MDFYGWNMRFSSLGANGDDGFVEKSGGFSGDCGNLDGVVKNCCQSLVLDEVKGELVKAQGKVAGRKRRLLSDEKALAALKNHSEAERRRRERINAHLDTLRGLVPCTDKMDKATLLAQVIRQVKQLKTSATQASTGLLIPHDANELTIEKLDGFTDDGSLTFRVSFCCKFRSELLTDLKRALVDHKVDISRAELSTLGDHLKIMFEFASTKDEAALNSVREALNSVVEKASIAPEYPPRTSLSNKRRRYCL